MINKRTGRLFRNSRNLRAHKTLGDRFRRPFAAVQISNYHNGKKIYSPELLCLIDTGSYFTILPDHAVEGLGIHIAGYPMESIHPYGSSTIQLPKVNDVELLIQGVRVICPQVLFYDSQRQGFDQILSSNDLMHAFPRGIAIDREHWYY